ncbi:MAG TPA: tRNA (adenine-N1)-methyltransferase [Candidatus Lokiarchaeia archaeon]|nr:tRNA (adenine-N1)-methyltransferase [Candidatus Lokiarchaeia archaeon]
MPINLGDYVLIARGMKYRWLVKIEQGKQFHTNWGVIYYDGTSGIVGKEYGDVYKSPTSNAGFLLLKPLLHELATKFARKTQIVYPKDIGYIIVNAGIVPGSRVLEAGTGSGAMTMLLCSIAGAVPPGKVVSYEIVERHHEAAKKNIEKAGLTAMADLRFGNILDPAIQDQLAAEEPFDACFFDMPSPWDVIDLATRVLKPSGVFCSFSPVIEQVKKTVAVLAAGCWFDIEAVDMQLRSWQVKENATRPLSHGHHSGYIVFARKTNMLPPMDWTRKNRKELARGLATEDESGDDTGDSTLNFLDDPS